MLTPAEIESASMLFDSMMKRLEESVMQDIIRRIRVNSEITRSADWQMHRLYELGQSRTELSRLIKKGLHIDDEGLTDMFRDIICKGYARDDRLYKMTAKPHIPFAENTGLQQYINAVAKQTGSTMRNLSQSMGFSVNVGGKVQFQPAATYYQNTLDNAVNGIATGAFDYNTVLKRTVKEMTDSGLRTVDYASGHVDRVDVAARRAVMTGLTQITAKVNDDNAKALGTDTFEISWHSGARPTHQVWQGRWYTEKELTTVCGLGSVTGLCGANCYHSYYPVIPGVSVPNYTAEELDEMNRRENEPVEYNGKEYTKYEATQRQRYLERKMRAQRQEIKLLQDGGADENDLIAARCRYRQTSQTYKDFSNAMELPEQRQRVTIDGLGNIGQGEWKNPSKPVAKSGGSGIMNQKVTDRLINIYNETDNGVFDFDEIEKNLASSFVGASTAKYIEDDGIMITMNYDLNAPENLCGTISKKDITVYAVNHYSLDDVSETIIHEACHRRFSWDKTQEGEINCRIMEHFHTHRDISDGEIRRIVDFVKQEYSYLPEGDLYGY